MAINVAGMRTVLYCLAAVIVVFVGTV